MIGYACSWEPSVIGTGNTLIRVPRTLSRPLPVISLHGAGTFAATAADPYFTSLVRAGFAVIQDDESGNNWGAPSLDDDVDAMHARLAEVGCDPDRMLLFGGSMGGLDALNYLRRHPEKVAGAVLVAPLVDLASFYGSNELGFAAEIAAAWGVANGDPLPAEADPLNNSAEVAATGVPITVQWSAGDTTIPADSLSAFTAAVPTARLVKISDTAPHGTAELTDSSLVDCLDLFVAATGT